MNKSKIKFEEYLRKFEDEITLLNSSYQLFLHLNNCLIMKRKEMEYSPFFFTLTIKSLLHYSIVNICKLYENYKGNERSDFNLNKFLNFVEQNSNEIFTKNITNKTIEEDRNVIKDQNKILDNFFGWRDKHITHFSKKHLNHQDISDNYPIKSEDFDKLILISIKIINKYNLLYGEEKLIFEFSDKHDIDNIFYCLTKEIKKENI